MSVTQLKKMFGADLSPAELTKAAVDYRDAVEAAPSTENGQVDVDIMSKSLVPRQSPQQMVAKALGLESMSGDQFAAISAAAEAQLGTSFLGKDITTTSPVGTGLVAFDLEAPAKMLAPVLTPWRNKFPRLKGVGTSHRYKRITGISGSGTGGVADVNPGFADASQLNVANPGSANPLYLNRPGKISYTGDDTNLPYVQFGLSDETSWFTYFTAMGFQDVRALSRQSTLFASMMAEEKVLLFGRGTLGGFSGALSAPSGTPTGAARVPNTGETAITGMSTNIYVKIVAESGTFGVSQAGSASAGIAVAANRVVDITIPATVTGATGYQVFVSTGSSDPGDASRYLVTTSSYPNNLSPGRTPTLTFTIQGALPTAGQSVAAYQTVSGGIVNLATTDGLSARSTNYDGVFPWIAAKGGYTNALNAAFSTSSPGDEFQAAFAATWASVRAEPEEIWLSGQDRSQISNTLRGQTASNYRIEITEDMLAGVKLGSVVTAIQNQSAGNVVDIKVHPYMPQGNAIILQSSITVPNVDIANAWQVWNVQDYMSIDWPVLQMSYDCSVYWTSVLAAYGPDRSSLITGIQPAT